MQANNKVHNPQVRDALGASDVHASPDEQLQDSVSAGYVIRSWNARELPECYRNFIIANWLRTLRFGNPIFKLMDSQAFYSHYYAFIERILSNINAIVRFSLLSDDMDVTLGFSVSRGEILDYVYVGYHYRGKGIGRKLLPTGITTFTHITKTAEKIWNKSAPHWKFNPFV